ncbi:hypothetical protein GCM10010372_84020 [Streptomyces tauricus]|nr:hypothetical protein GCM10010372_84020 [Streptomyces tauricus]
MTRYQVSYAPNGTLPLAWGANDTSITPFDSSLDARRQLLATAVSRAAAVITTLVTEQLRELP